ncbi:hypothetical protein [Aquimonas voraii]|uniref:Fibronectin type-III domain-containing protein n=1 Tax=Aquimonas voraii TaxID=265719 RepID=A0A1G6X5L9_9GAMM|nr:hypothetical protein [Aquimonas voraii]SDD73421.1 hypothetical protein SAMN04488509_10650 [Aquimonas voraii]
MHVLLPRLAACRAARSLLTLVLALLAIPAWAQIAVTPALPTPQSTLSLAAVPPAAGSYRFRLRTAGAVLLQSGALNTGTDGSVRASLALGAIAPGSYTLTLDDNSNGAQVFSRALTVGAPLGLTATPDPLRPGDALRLALSGLRPAPTQVRINGQRVFGPELLDGGAATAAVDLRLPAATPTGGNASLRVEQLEGAQVIAAGDGSVRVLAAGFSAPARVLNLAGLPANLRIGEAFTVSGRLELRQGSPAGLRARLNLRLPDGRVLPLDDGRGVVAADGSFAIRGWVRSIWSGLPLQLPASGQGQTDIVFTEPDPPSPRSPSRGPFSLPAGSVNLPAEGDPVQFRVRLRTPDGQPIQGGIVTIDGNVGSILPREPGRALAGLEPKGTRPVAASNPGMALNNLAQLGPILQQTAPALYARILGQCPVTLWRGETDANGEVTVTLTFTELVAASARHLGQQANDGNTSGPGDNAPLESLILLRASGLTVGYTANADGGIAQGIEYPIIYQHGGGTFCGGDSLEYFECTNPLGFNPLLVYTLRPYSGTISLPLDPDIGGLPRSVDAAGLATWGPITTFPGSAFNDAQGLNIAGDLPVRFTLDQGLFGVVQSALLSKWVRNAQNQWVEQTLGSFPVSPSQACAGPGDTEFEVKLPGFHRSPWGVDRYRIRVQGTPASAFGEYRFKLETRPPPLWWRQPPEDMLSRSLAQWTPARAHLQMTVRPDPVAVNATPPQEMPTLENRSQGEERLSGSLDANGQTSFVRVGESENRTVNREAEPRSATRSGLAYSETIGPERILDTGWMPVFRFAWGVPPIAAATFGIDARFWADLLVQMQAELDLETGQLASLLKTQPSVGGAIDAFFNFSAVLGLVDMTAGFTPSFGVAMPVTVVNGRLDPAQSEPCFRFRMQVRYDVSVGLCPLCVEFGDTAVPIDEREPNNSCQIPDLGSVKSEASTRLAALGITRLAPVSAAFDALGQGGLAEAREGRVQFRPWQGGGFAAPVDLGAAVGASAPQLAYHAPGQALLVYERSSLSESAFRAASLQAATASRHLAFRRLQNGSWGAAQNLTAPGAGGEGQVSLAACPAGSSGCPTGGEVLAVWTRDAGADLFGFRFEVWHAFFRNGAWTAPARVAEPGAGSDMHARATYANGVPIVSFTRAGGRSLAAQATRQLMYRVLPGGVPAPVGGAPEGVVWQALTSDAQGRPVLAFTAHPAGAAQIGNQAELWSALGTCSSNSCSFASQRQTDALGRGLRAEAPTLLRTAGDDVQLAFRGLGFSPNAQGLRAAPGDPIGMLAGTGSLVSVVPRFDAAPTSLLTLGDGAGLWMNPVLVQNPATQGLLALADVSAAPVFNVAAFEKSLAFEPLRPTLKSTPVEGSLQLLSLADAPDFAVEAVLPVDTVLQPGGTIRVQAALRARGKPWQGAAGGEALRIEAAWDAEPGVGEFAGRTDLNAFGPGGQALVDLQVAVPAQFGRDETRRLFVRVQLGTQADADGANDVGSADIGALEVPGLPEVEVRQRDRHVLLEWPAATDARVSAWRIWRANPANAAGEQDWTPVGSSFVPAFIDFTGAEGRTHWYRVTALTDAGIESAPGPAAVAVRDMRAPTGVFANGFERVDEPPAAATAGYVMQAPEG